MNWFLLIFLIVSSVSAYTLSRIEGINTTVQNVEFDYFGNVYVASGLFVNVQIHKLNPDKELVWTITLPDYVALVPEIHVNRQNDPYFNFYCYGFQSLGILKSNWTHIEEIDQFPYSLFFMDEEGNLFYNRPNGIHLLRPDETVSILIKNLENFFVFDRPILANDKAGNVYLQVDNPNSLNKSVALLTKEALQGDAPHAQFLNVLDNYNQTLNDLIVDEKNDLWILVTDLDANKSYVKKLWNGLVQTIATDNYADFKGISAKDRIYIVAGSKLELDVIPNVFYITLQNVIVEIPELQNLTSASFDLTKELSDNDGYAYFKTYGKFSGSLGSLIVINPNETVPTPIFPENTGININEVKIDFNDDLWILSSPEIYHLKKGEIIPEQVKFPPDFNSISYNLMANWKREEIYVLCTDGLFIVDEN